MSESSRLFLMLRRIAITMALLALTMLLALGCGGSDRRGGGGDDDDDSAGSDDDDTADDDDSVSDDDDSISDDDDTTGSGASTPVIQSVMVCEQPNPQATDPACVAPDCFYAQFNIMVTDGDGDLLNGTLSSSVGGGAPQALSITEDPAAAGGMTGFYAGIPAKSRGTEMPYSITITDAAGNASQPYPGVWSIPAATGIDDCPL